MNPSAPEVQVDTLLVTSGRAPSEHHGFVNPPVYRGSTVLAPSVADLLGYTQPYVYGRRGTPTTAALQDAVRALDRSAGVVLCPSGLAAILTALSSCLSAGDHLLMTDAVYKPARTLCDGVLRRAGIETTFFDPRASVDTVAASIRPRTRALYLEAPASQSMEMCDVPALASLAHDRGLTVLLDNTWATPLFFDAFAHGVDLVIQAGTKYIAGHADVMIGMVSASAPALPGLEQYQRDTGQCVGSDDAFLALRGLRTLGVRIRQHQANALRVARWLAARPEVQRVFYPALEDDPGHALWARDFTGATGLFSVVLQPASSQAVAALLEGLAYFGLGYSWGGFESLAMPFDCSAYRTASQWNPGGPCVRFHIGLESADDLIGDLEAGFARFNHAAR